MIYYHDEREDIPFVSEYSGRYRRGDKGGNLMLDVVRTESGLIRGERCGDPRISVFRSIPYAAPPVGQLRWQPPIPPQPWEGVREVRDFPPMAMQNNPGLNPNDFYTPEIHPTAGDYPVSEDCLYLNIWTPARSADEKLAVLFYIHGGGFFNGYSYELEFDGEHVAKNGIILVTANYRLGAFGFFAHEELSSVPDRPSGNQGLEDQLAALKWVKRNIAAFGGDPNRITIAGQSAGGMSVQCLMMSPLARGLFTGAILMSCGGLAPEGFGITVRRTVEQAREESRLLLRKLGVSSFGEALGCSAEEVLQASLEMRKEYGGFIWNPTIDGCFLTEGSRESLLRGNTADVPCMIGACRSESIPRPDRQKEYASPDQFLHFIDRTFDEAGRNMIHSMHLRTDADVRKLITSEEAFATSIATRAYAVRREQDNRKTYVYLFDHDIPGDDSGSFHGSDLWFVFDSLARCWRPFIGKHYDLARQVSAYWANFVRAGDPNGTDRFGNPLPLWKCYQRNKPFVMTFRDHPEPDERPESILSEAMIHACLKES